MEQVKDVLRLIFGSRLIVDGNGRTFVKLPLWVCVLVGLSSLPLALITALLVVAFGMRVRIIKA